MASTVARVPVVRQFALTGTPALLPNVPPGIVAARMVSVADWTYGDTPATAIFPVPAGDIEEIPTANIGGIYFTGSAPLIVVFFV